MIASRIDGRDRGRALLEILESNRRDDHADIEHRRAQRAENRLDFLVFFGVKKHAHVCHREEHPRWDRHTFGASTMNDREQLQSASHWKHDGGNPTEHFE